MYGTVAGFRAYHTARGRDVSAYDDDAVVSAALLVASEWLDATYRSSFKGLPSVIGQADEWPRVGVYDDYGYAYPSDTVPSLIENAVYEAALRELQTPGTLTLDFTPGKYKRVSIAGSVSVDYALPMQAADIQLQFPIIDQILSPLLGGGNASALSGAVGRA